MGLNFHVPLPGPFSYSARVGSPTKAVGKAAKIAFADRPARCDCRRRPPVRTRTRPENESVGVGTAILALVTFLVVVLVIAGLVGSAMTP